MSKKVLITGASVAGCTAAWWLGRTNRFDVTVVEKHPEFRDGGQNIDIRGAGREVLRKMGLEEKALRAGTKETGTAWVNEDGGVIAEIDTAELGTDGPTAEMEILRGDLARILYEDTRQQAMFRFGDTIAAMDERADGVAVTFDSGATGNFDIVVIAEGVGSQTREMVFPGDNDPYPLDMTLAYFTIPSEAHDDRRWRWYHTTEGRGVSLRPDQHGTARAMLSVQKEPEGEQDWPRDKQMAWLQERFGDVGWESRRVLSGMLDTDDFYFDVLRQVRMPKWSKGRVVLCGDAAWCVTPLGGIGATLAVVGGYVLAGELARSEHHGEALARYEGHLRPFVEKAQNIKKIVPRIANPHSRFGLAFMHATVKLAAAPVVKDLMARFLANRSDDIDLPDYELTAV
ncbi:FAD-dependent monooxygenase (plasmid) [Aliirhizobium terrae]|uniref:FAD-dependent monooxygenase n=1 Tax=Terrirhizobium terrae TaxID=2926709 RepID=UPI0025774C27|nr:FAD-dependent monooxygenase [Rhizobium sp. CC-CFT758]WJH38511.1 FAD-dependent monooxygenase [Rhizobium sp. CC-CFT758]